MFIRFALALLAIMLAMPGLQPISAKETTSVEPLVSGLHFGFGTFSPVVGDQQALLDDRIAEATNAGMDVSRVMVDWAEIETSPGVYDFARLSDQLERVPEGTRLFLTLGVTDVDRYSVPADLLEADGSLTLPLDDPAVIERYLTLLDELLPGLVLDHGLFAISLANEPDVLLTERPAAEAAGLAAFTRSVNGRLDGRFPGLDFTLTISGGGLAEPATFVSELIDATDIAAFNWGCIDLATFQVTDPEQIPGEIDLLLARADGRDILIQELSCPAGYSDRLSFIGASPEHQATWFAAFFAALAAESQFRAAFVFDLVDWPEDLAALFTAFLREEGLTEIADRYEELQRTWGLLTFDEVSSKPAWTVFLDAIESNTAR